MNESELTELYAEIQADTRGVLQRLLDLEKRLDHVDASVTTLQGMAGMTTGEGVSTKRTRPKG